MSRQKDVESKQENLPGDSKEKFRKSNKMVLILRSTTRMRHAAVTQQSHRPVARKRRETGGEEINLPHEKKQKKKRFGA